ncbi:MAG TPA: efflux RND transporter periplasmic adaptor subunit [Xanthobacteraceae bacterium]|nr:efflux RND transporter periplasmic adaptor subunit [Xanthobacteraceae bacterium]
MQVLERFSRRRIWLIALALGAMAAGTSLLLAVRNGDATTSGQAEQAPAATPVSAATVEQHEVALWDEFSGRLEAVERVEVRSRVAGAIQSVHFREGALVKQGDLLITIDPAPYAAEVERAQAQVVAAEARVSLTKNDADRGQQLAETRAISQRDLDQRVNARREAEANLQAARAALESARLNLDYTQVRAPVSGRVGKLEITVGNLVAAGPGAPVLTTLVSIDPIYASFNAEEQVVARALKNVGRDIERIPVRMTTLTTNGDPILGRLQLVDNQVDARSGTVRVRAVFANPHGDLLPGQFARLSMGQGKSKPALLVSERAIGTDQNKKFVMVVGSDDRAEYREVTLGPEVDGLRVVASGLSAGERIVVNGLQRVRPGALLAAQLVEMDGRTAAGPKSTSDVVQR